MICPNCNYTWKAKTTKPKCCPKCKQYIDYNKQVDRLVFEETELKELLQKRILELKDHITGKKFMVTVVE